MNIKYMFWFSLQFLPDTFLILRSTQGDRSEMSLGLQVKCPSYLSDFNVIWIFLTDFQEKYSNVKFHENSSSGSRGVPIKQTDRPINRMTDGRTDMTNLIVPFRNFANAPISGRVSLILKQNFLCLCKLTRPPARLRVDCRLRNAKIEYL